MYITVRHFRRSKEVAKEQRVLSPRRIAAATSFLLSLLGNLALPVAAFGIFCVCTRIVALLEKEISFVAAAARGDLPRAGEPRPLESTE